jgi:hypothetical protein
LEDNGSYKTEKNSNIVPEASEYKLDDDYILNIPALFRRK